MEVNDGLDCERYRFWFCHFAFFVLHGIHVAGDRDANEMALIQVLPCVAAEWIADRVGCSAVWVCNP